MNNTSGSQPGKLWLIARSPITISIGIAISYFLGRLYLNAYYRYMGIPPSVLFFPTEYYVFSSVVSLITLILVIFWIWVTYTSFSDEQPFKINIQSIRSDIRSADRETKQKAIERLSTGISMNLGMMLWTILFILILIKTEKFAPIFSSFTFLSFWGGFSIGYILFLFFWVMYYLGRILYHVPPFTYSPRQQLSGWAFQIIVIIYLFITLPLFSTKAAEIAAFNDFNNLPYVTIISESVPPQMESSLAGSVGSIDAKLILVNNDTAYIYKASSDNGTNAITRRPSDGEIYTIKMSDIKNLIYHPSGK